jgi:hypothetical protein
MLPDIRRKIHEIHRLSDPHRAQPPTDAETFPLLMGRRPPALCDERDLRLTLLLGTPTEESTEEKALRLGLTQLHQQLIGLTTNYIRTMERMLPPN